MEEKRFQEYGKLFVSNNRKSVILHHSCYATLTKEELRKAKVATFLDVKNLTEVNVCGFRKGMESLYGFSTILIDTEDNDKICIIDYPLTEVNRYLDGNFDNQENIDKFIVLSALIIVT